MPTVEANRVPQRARPDNIAQGQPGALTRPGRRALRAGAWLSTLLVACSLLSACGRDVDPEANNVEVEGGYDVSLRWTPHGIPHVNAKDWGSLGFGVAYVAATDSLCTLAREVLKVRGEQARWLGPDEDRRDSDVFHRALLTPAVLAHAQRDQPAQVEALTGGWVAGYNRYLKDHPPESRPVDCRDAAWVQPIDRDDAARLAVAVGIRYGLGRAQPAVLSARPPAAPPTPAATAAGDAGSDDRGSALRREGGDASLGSPSSFGSPSSLGSNAIAFGRDATASRRGLLLGNPHYPWEGADRFHAMHLTIPGQLDSMGAGLLTSLLVSIGFNRDVAWTHTVSTARRATLFALQLVPGKPTHYRWGSGIRALERRTISVEVLGPDGKLAQHAQDVWMSHLGPVVADAELPWTATQAFVLRDANLHNNRAGLTYLRMNVARTTTELLAALRTGQGVAWANTIAADRNGDTLYADVGRMPNLDYPFLVRCGLPTITRWREQPVIALRTEPACDWPADPAAAAPGLLAAGRMPVLQRTDYVLNSNDSHWLSHARQRLEGFSPVLGDEGTVRNLRTRTAHAAIETFLADGGRVTTPGVQALVTSHANPIGAALARDMLSVCALAKGKVELANGNPADVSRACAAMKLWDGSGRATSRAALLWAAFWPRAAKVENVWRTPFRIDNPLGTPSGLNIDSQPVREGLLRALVESQDALAAVGIAPDAALGTVQYVEAGEQRIPVPGLPGDAGAYSVIESQLDTNGRARVRSGNSWVQVVGWSAEGMLQANAMLAYGQSDDPDSPHHTDLTRLYSAGQWIELPFTEAQIEAAGGTASLHLLDARE